MEGFYGARSLNVLLQEYAFCAFVMPKTGIAYAIVVLSNLTEIGISAMRLRSGSLRMRGVEDYREINISTGVAVSPYVEILIPVNNWSSTYYPLLGYTYRTHIVGLLTCDLSNLSVTNLPELDFNASKDSITVCFNDLISPPICSSAKCVSSDSIGSIDTRDLIFSNLCLFSRTGHFAITVESISASSALASLINPYPSGVVPQKGKTSNRSKLWIIIMATLDGLVLGMLLMVIWVGKLKRRKAVERMEKMTDVKEQLYMKSIGDTKAPFAMVTRSQPILGSE